TSVCAISLAQNQIPRPPQPVLTQRRGFQSRATAMPADRTSRQKPKGPQPWMATGLFVEQVVRLRRLELPLRFKNSDLNAARLPIPPQPQTCFTPASPGLTLLGWAAS